MKKKNLQELKGKALDPKKLSQVRGGGIVIDDLVGF